MPQTYLGVDLCPIVSCNASPGDAAALGKLHPKTESIQCQSGPLNWATIYKIVTNYNYNNGVLQNSKGPIASDKIYDYCT